MSLTEKFLEEKKAMYAKFDKASEVRAKAMDDATDEFLESIKSLAMNASDEELVEFIFKDNDALEDVDKIAMITAVKEVRGKDKKSDGPGIVIIGL